MLESSAMIDEWASARQKQEEAELGRRVQVPIEELPEALRLEDEVTPQVIDLTGGYSIGMFQSAQVLAGLAAELALKFAYEQENTTIAAPSTHDLFVLYQGLPDERKREIETDYSVRLRQHMTAPDPN